MGEFHHFSASEGSGAIILVGCCCSEFIWFWLKLKALI
jgi:hypothetical protein